MVPTQLEQSVAAGSPVGPASFVGQEWLVILNLGSSTALFLIATIFSVDLIGHLWRNKGRDFGSHPVTLFRVILLLFSGSFVFRKGAQAYVLWRWAPENADATAFALILQRFIDPIADAMQFGAIALCIATAPTLISQLRKHPWRVPVRQRVDELKRPAMFAFASFVTAFGIVATR